MDCQVQHNRLPPLALRGIHEVGEVNGDRLDQSNLLTTKNPLPTSQLVQCPRDAGTEGSVCQSVDVQGWARWPVAVIGAATGVRVSMS